MDSPELIEALEIKIEALLLEARIKGLSYKGIDWLIGEIKKKTALRVVAETELKKVG